MNLLPSHSLFMDNPFEQFFAPLGQLDGDAVFTPRVDIKETESQYLISAELPGVKKEDIHISLDHGMLTLEAECRQEKEEKEQGKVVRQERRYGKIMRSFQLGNNVLTDNIDAEFKDGVLTLTAPKIQQEEEKATTIEVH